MIYINDMPYASKILDIHLFADDTSIFISNKKLQELETVVNSELTFPECDFETEAKVDFPSACI